MRIVYSETILKQNCVEIRVELTLVYALNNTKHVLKL